MKNYTEEEYEEMIAELFSRVQSFQNAGKDAYKPGIDNMIFMDNLLGHPHHNWASIHIAGTNGKGSVSNMMASWLAACGLKVGLYTSPHIHDFRERMRIIDGHKSEMISKAEVLDFMNQWGETTGHLNLSFFEITTAMAFDWFSKQKVDIAVIETGLGGRLDSTNIITPLLSIITNIGLDHCDLLGDSLGEIAFEKAGIIKPGVPAVVGEVCDETRPVFEHKVMYSNNSGLSDFTSRKTDALSFLHLAEYQEPILWDKHDDILASMDLQGIYQKKNLRTVLTAIDVLCKMDSIPGKPEMKFSKDHELIRMAIENTAKRMDFHGRWEKLCDKPYILCDIGHNEHGLKYNFAQLENMMSEGKFSKLTIIYGCVNDKDIDAVLNLFPDNAEYIFTQAQGKRAMEAEEIKRKYLRHCSTVGSEPHIAAITTTVVEAINYAKANSTKDSLIYIGGSTYIVSEAVPLI